MIHHRNKLTPYEGIALSGIVEKTFLRGVKVFEAGDFLDPPVGQVVLRR